MKKKDIKNKKHNAIVNDFERQKQKHLEKLTNKILKDDEKNQVLKSKIIKDNFWDKF
jgi:hypothetical protein